VANIKAHVGAVNLDTGALIEETFLDNGDGTYARLVGAAGTVSIGQITVADGGDAAQGTTTDASTANTVIGRLKKLLSVLPAALTGSGNLRVAVQEALPAGTALLGTVGVDQSTPGTTNAVESNHYGTPSAGASVSVGTSSTAVLGANAARQFLALCNDSANVIYVDLSGATAVASKGVRLNANGGAVLLDRYVPTSAIKAIASGAASVLTVQEG
jgi:hypothetical protein